MGEPEVKRAKTEPESTTVGLEKNDYDVETRQALEEIDKVQNEIDVINEKASDEILKVEQKYNQMRKPHFEQRNNLIKKIPNFWVTTFLNHPQISKVLDEDEEECLHYLTKIEVEEFDDIKSGYKIKFIFDTNPYFENQEITKEFNWTGSDPRTTTSEVKWKQGKKKLGHLGNGPSNANGIERSFFDWLCYDSDPVSDEFAEIIKDDIWPNPLQYYLVPDVETGDDIDDEEDDLENDDDPPDEDNIGE